MLNLDTLFDDYEHLLLLSPAVLRFHILRRRTLEHEGYIRIRVELINDELLEISEFWTDVEGMLNKREYGYHWQGAEGQLVSRWDNVNHHRSLLYAPHHVHLADRVEGIAKPPDFETVLHEVEKQLGFEV
ncbi:MAG: hypothetical protein JW850_19395 [Thermoflexales bacterium]|nr:hypothetical protein [Thermoflexales bacterium]